MDAVSGPGIARCPRPCYVKVLSILRQPGDQTMNPSEQQLGHGFASNLAAGLPSRMKLFSLTQRQITDQLSNCASVFASSADSRVAK